MKLRCTRRAKFGIALTFAILLALTIAPLIAHRYLVPVQFNQFLIEQAEAEYGVKRNATPWQRWRSAYSSGIRAMRHIGDTDSPQLDNPDAVLAYVLKWAPSYAIVYPTEIFYYFRFDDPEGHQVWGNLRIAEAGEGRIGISYFHPGSAAFSHKVYNADDGLIVSQSGPRDHVVAYAGRRVRFHVPEVVTSPPESIALDSQERYVARIVDESGVRFHLLFNKATNSFYMLLDESEGCPDRLEATDEGLTLGARTGFVYFDETDLDRRLLIGVRLSNIAENNYFDGPGDQVPYEVPIRDLLHLAYPHTLLEPGIDEHGVLLGTPEWQRIAVTPFHRYQTLDELRERIHDAQAYDERSAQRTVMTKEWWNSPMWIVMKMRELAAEGKGLAGDPPGLLTREELDSMFPEPMFRPEAAEPVTPSRPQGTKELAS